MLAHDRIVLAELQLFGRLAGVLLRHVEEARAGGAQELDEDGGWLGHDEKSRKALEIETQGAHHTDPSAGVKGSKPDGSTFLPRAGSPAFSHPRPGRSSRRKVWFAIVDSEGARG
ncbi:hypothetical protein MTBSS4_10214 [Magnetospirillum sp. SS-4]|nr:hypothetical protein MTBSS4_10214 [Magnetospirillum sp. SS-4]